MKPKAAPPESSSAVRPKAVRVSLMKASRSAAVGCGGGGAFSFSLLSLLPGERPARRLAEPPGLGGSLLGAELGAECAGGGGTEPLAT